MKRIAFSVVVVLLIAGGIYAYATQYQRWDGRNTQSDREICREAYRNMPLTEISPDCLEFFK